MKLETPHWTRATPHATLTVMSNFKATLEVPRSNPKDRLDFLAGCALGLALRNWRLSETWKSVSRGDPIFSVPGYITVTAFEPNWPEANTPTELRTWRLTRRRLSRSRAGSLLSLSLSLCARSLLSLSLSLSLSVSLGFCVCYSGGGDGEHSMAALLRRRKRVQSAMHQSCSSRLHMFVCM